MEQELSNETEVWMKTDDTLRSWVTRLLYVRFSAVCFIVVDAYISISTTRDVVWILDRSKPS